MAYLTLPQAAQISGKSIQTMRRMVKSKKIIFVQEDTPQGYVYLIDQDSLENFLKKSKGTRLHRAVRTAVKEKATDKTSGEASKSDIGEIGEESKGAKAAAAQYGQELAKLSDTIERLVEQSQKDKENFFRLIETFQQRIKILEDHIKFLEQPKRKTPWWKIRIW